jgi:hypothetical protein
MSGFDGYDNWKLRTPPNTRSLKTSVSASATAAAR